MTALTKLIILLSRKTKLIKSLAMSLFFLIWEYLGYINNDHVLSLSNDFNPFRI